MVDGALREGWDRESFEVPLTSVGADAPCLVEVWRVPVIVDPASLSEAERLLNSAERARGERLHGREEQRRHITARHAVRVLLSGYLGSAPEGLRFEDAALGKPRLASPHAATGLEFNLAHAGHWVYAVVSRCCAVGIDIERTDRGESGGSRPGAFMTPTEARHVASLPSEARPLATLQLWTRKEAVAKALGRGLAMRMDTLEVGLGETGTFARLRLDALDEPDVLVRGLPCAEGYSAALAVVDA